MFLDAYNNVPCVGHAHPRVTEAIARQSRLVNTHLRYLHPKAIELAERLVATCPTGLDTVLFVNSGSEANDLAWRLATPRHRPPRSPLHPVRLPRHLGRHRADVSRGAASSDREHSAQSSDGTPPTPIAASTSTRRSSRHALARLEAKGLPPAAVILDGVMQSDGVQALAPGARARPGAPAPMRRARCGSPTRCRAVTGATGEAMWSFERFGIEPDFVTLGKPMGNGHPVAAVITRREFLEHLADETVIFSTFGGNPVSAAAALAVLDVLEDERVLPRVAGRG